MKPAGDELTPDGGEATTVHPPVEQLIGLRREDRPDAVVVQVSGAVDGLTAPRLRTLIVAALDQLDGRPLVLDLTEVGFFGSSGLRALADGTERAATRPGFEPLRVVVDHNRPVLRPIELTGYDAVLALYHDVDAAVAGTVTE
ncbi:STAS domain-containing protein [Pseudonocardia sp. MH-G8]|uniref:STAS domain-containing protein n=1 Tax=Pseudonocardia sp. MH-G8 TaxID=1854588 RepID=UPI000BA001C0|nr:STAS domain-containing protein [Pseudonocardia sp. MH-G8]OZM81310.1 anti-anti-sigma factor [Pseudonocardia sp. MH-G8]